MPEILGIHYETNIQATIGLIIGAAFLGSKLFQRLGIPQVVGFIVMGVVMGSSFLNIVPFELMGIAYVVLRSLGKFSGAWLGGWLGGAEPAVRDNLGFGLLSQAGVAIGLALTSASKFSNLGEDGKALGNLILNVVTSTTFIVQIIGPIFVKLAISRAGEIGQAKFGDDAWASEGTHE